MFFGTTGEVEVWVATDLSNRKSLLQQGGEFLSLDFHCRQAALVQNS